MRIVRSIVSTDMWIFTSELFCWLKYHTICVRPYLMNKVPTQAREGLWALYLIMIIHRDQS